MAEVPSKGRNTMGVKFAHLADDDRIIAIARNSERNLAAQDADDTADAEAPEADTAAAAPGKDENA